MKVSFFLIALMLFNKLSISQDLSGIWYGKITQQEGGFSELYDLELTLSHKKNIRGESNAYIPNILSVKIGLKGYVDRDSIRLSESIFDIREEILPPSWIACIKNMNLKYYKQGGDEFLKGVWDGKSKQDTSDCLPGNIILSKSKHALEQFIVNDGFQRPYLIDTLKPVPEFLPVFLTTDVRKVKEIEVRNKHIQLRISDYLNVDNDTVSIFLNRDNIAGHKRISKKPIRLNIDLDGRLDLNEIILFAENLGKIPPNTSQLLVIDGNNTHKLVIESDRQKSAAIYLKYKP